MDNCDALIIGGGPAGSTCAKRLVRGGLDVVVMDKAEFPRDKVCAGWITPAVVDLLDLDTAAYGEHNVLQPIRAFRTGLIAGGQLETRYDAVVSYGIRRCEFDNHLLRRSGARLRLGEAVDTLERRSGGWIVNNQVSAPLLIGAGGHFCPVARMLGARLGADEPAVAAKEIEFEMSALQAAQCTVNGDTPELFFTPDLKGYGWCFRKGRYLNIGLGREDSHHLNEHLRSFCEFLAGLGRIPADIPRKFQGHAYVLYGHAPRRLIAEDVLLIGDAAGLAYAESGEGIRPAIESALMAAGTVLGARGDYRARQLDPYVRDLQARFGPPLAEGSGVPASVRNMLAAMLLRSRWFSRHVVLDRWFLRSAQAALQRPQ